ncbi:hypothetical protein [Streptacidiphilus sp. PAMC 29251]
MTIVQDALHRVLMESHRFDSGDAVNESIKRAVLALVDALAYRDGIPDRTAYIEALAELHRDDPNPLTAMCITAASWLAE